MPLNALANVELGHSIIFVHGLGSNPDTTWQARNDSIKPSKSHPAVESLPGHQEYICWITDFIPEDIDAASRRKIRVFFYNHDSYWRRDAVQDRLWNLGNNLLHHISSRVRRTEEVDIIALPVSSSLVNGSVVIGAESGPHFRRSQLWRSRNQAGAYLSPCCDSHKWLPSLRSLPLQKASVLTLTGAHTKQKSPNCRDC